MGSPRDKRHRQTKRVLLNIYNQKRKEWMSRRLKVVTSTEVMNFAQFLDLSQFSYPDSVGYRGGWVPKRKYTATPWQVHTNDSLNISLKIPTTIYSDDWGKRNTHTYWGLLGTESEMTSISGDLKCHNGQLFEAYGSKLIYWVLAKGQLTVGPVGPWITHPVMIFLVSKYIIGIDILSS